jgi:hypothetical protein
LVWVAAAIWFFVGVHSSTTSIERVFDLVPEPVQNAATLQTAIEHAPDPMRSEVPIAEDRAQSASATSGATLIGFLMDEQFETYSGHVHARLTCATNEDFVDAGATTAGDDGSFSLQLPKQGLYDVFAEAGDAGTAEVRGFFMGPGSQKILLMIGGPGIVRGRVLDEAGRAAPDVELMVVLAAIDHESFFSAWGDPRAAALRRAGGGSVVARTRTDADGAFEVHGLRNGSFVVRARTPADPGMSEYPHRLNDAAIASDGTAREYAFLRPHLAVRVVNEDGSPWPDHAAVAGRDDLGQCKWISWPNLVDVIAAPSARDATSRDHDRIRMPGSIAQDGEIVFEVEDERMYQVGLLGVVQPWRPQDVRVPRGASRVEVTLTALAGARAGELSVSIHDRWSAESRTGLAVRIEDAASGFPLAIESAGPAMRWMLPVGRYRVAVQSHAYGPGGWHGPAEYPPNRGRFETVVEIAHDSPTSVDATVPMGARLDLRLTGEVREQDRDWIRKWIQVPTDVECWASRAEIVLVPETGWPCSVYFAADAARCFGPRTSLTTSLTLGTEQTSHALPAGRYRLEARMPGGRVASAPLVLVDNETVSATLAFD